MTSLMAHLLIFLRASRDYDIFLIFLMQINQIYHITSNMRALAMKQYNQ